ncbi:MAG: biopolymer transporter ExbD [Candidatus Dactylopiibacterium carminicum]|uniref:Biopolymer transporter ExbD n=1 Tax=Candidatus Dactylopiibacterium carminicum TaxID=857335 RepID=A0A272EYW7_9RHOO|nr:biopolymer transporter ExbD [Candidatus Dactylopiibacterium carminicum]KAF7600825.1 biopolymer transporter ExbD [Candidatus Dactylopiibacterium carminicum]PAS95324.1 MAG: biopolymer transporter ExbD [Candidatus Dactylopiibacterium carminicum]PAS98664.1 MAG: biopolymer transporter ExbD [Candidatus Dactylopiibacterium carminicum]PAT00831.1 MAG: biopolymer transporter ExbD [Candidatus Dactylopiibacterium carminicum]
MAFGGFNKEGGGAPMAEINMVPLIDVMLVLLVIFILTAPLLTHAVKVELPRTSSQELLAPPERIEIALTPTSEFFWDGERVDEAALETRFKAAGERVADAANAPEIHLRADKTTPYEGVAKVMAAAARAGLTKIAFVSQPD